MDYILYALGVDHDGMTYFFNFKQADYNSSKSLKNEVFLELLTFLKEHTGEYPENVPPYPMFLNQMESIFEATYGCFFTFQLCTGFEDMEGVTRYYQRPTQQIRKEIEDQEREAIKREIAEILADHETDEDIGKELTEEFAREAREEKEAKDIAYLEKLAKETYGG